MGWITYDADMNSDSRAENQSAADSGHNVVLVGIDGSDQARHALELALEEARAQELTVRLLGAYPSAVAATAAIAHAHGVPEDHVLPTSGVLSSPISPPNRKPSWGSWPSR